MHEKVNKHMLFYLRKVAVYIGVLAFVVPGKYVFASEVVSGEIETKTEEEMLQVILPSDTEHVFDFIMDPQKLISRTDAAAYGGSTFEEGGTLFFRRTDGGASEDYSSSSDALVIINTGSVDVDLALTARVSLDETEGMVMTDDRDFTEDIEASFYLALTDGEHTVAIDNEEEVSIHTTLSGISEEGTCSEYRFWLTGAVNEKGDWSEVTGAVPKVLVTWSVSPCREVAAEDTDTVLEEGDASEETEASTVSENKIEMPLEERNL